MLAWLKAKFLSALTGYEGDHVVVADLHGYLDSGDRLIGQVLNIYVDDEENFRFVDVAMGGFMGIGKKHRLVPVEAIAEEVPTLSR